MVADEERGKSRESQNREIDSRADRVLRFAQSTDDTVTSVPVEGRFSRVTVAAGHPIDLYGY